MSTGQAPLRDTVEKDVPAADITADESTVLDVIGFSGVVAGVSYVPEAAITGAADDNRTVSLVNRGTDGTGDTVIAEIAFDDGVDAAAFDELTVPLGEVVTVAEGDVLEWRSGAVGAGMVDPGGLVRVYIDRT